MAKGLRSDSNVVTTRQMTAPATGPASDATPPTGTIPLASITSADDLKAIEALTGTGSLHRTGSNTWALRQAVDTTDAVQFARLGLGVAADGTIPLLMSANLLTNPTPAIEVYADNGTTQANISATSYGIDGGGIFHGRHANGTKASPTRTLAGNIVGGIGGRAWENTTNDFQSSSPASIHFVSAEDQDAAARGSYLRFLTTPNGSGTRQERVVVTPNGMLVVRDTITGGINWNSFDGFGANAPDVGMLVASGTGGTRSVNAAMAVATTAGAGAGGAGYRGFLAGGDWQSPSATPTAKMLCFMGGSGHDGSVWTATKALISFVSAEGWSVGANGAYINFATTPAGSATRGDRARITATGNLLVGGTSESGLTGAGGARIFSTTEAAANTGALVVDGGGSFAKALRVESTTAATGATAGALIVAGGGGFAKSLWVSGTQTAGAPTNTIGLDGGSVLLRPSSGSGGNGGCLMLGAGTGSFFAAMKGNYGGGGTNPTGHIEFWLRALTADDALTRTVRFSLAGNVLVGTTTDTTAAQSLRVGGVLRTGTPSGGSQGEWMLGTYASRAARIDIGGSGYDLGDTAVGTFTPTISFGTPGDLAVVYTLQEGNYIRVGRLVTCFVRMEYTPTHTTAAGGLLVTGLPFTCETGGLGNNMAAPIQTGANTTWPAGRTQIVSVALTGTTTAAIQSGGAAIATLALTTVNVPTTLAQSVRGTIQYLCTT